MRRDQRVSLCRGGLAPTASLTQLRRPSGGRGWLEWCSAAVGGDGGVPGPTGADHGMQVPQDRGGDHGLSLGGRSLLCSRGSSGVGSGWRRQGWLVGLRRRPARRPGGVQGRPCPVNLVRPTKAPEVFSRGARPACLTSVRAVAKRRGSPVWARIAAAPTGEMPGIEVTRRVRRARRAPRSSGSRYRRCARGSASGPAGAAPKKPCPAARASAQSRAAPRARPGTGNV